MKFTFNFSFDFEAPTEETANMIANRVKRQALAGVQDVSAVEGSVTEAAIRRAPPQAEVTPKVEPVKPDAAE